MLVFLYGLIIGSFLNVCIFRIIKNESVILPASHCTSCKSNLKPVDLIPVLSYIILRGRCRYCKEKVSIQYPLVEVFTGFIFILLFNILGLGIILYKYLVLSCLLIVVSLIDYKTQEIPDQLIIFGLITGALFTFMIDIRISAIDGILGFVIGGGLFLLIAIASNGSMGGGDIKLMAVLGLWFGWKSILIVSLLSFIIGSVVSLILITFKIKGRKDYIPFGPFIALASLIVMTYGKQLLEWYTYTILK